MEIEKLDVIQTFSSNDGDLKVLHFRDLGFIPVRMYWLSGFTGASRRGQHAHRELAQIFILLSGTVRLSFWDGKQSFEIDLDRNSHPLFVAPGFWREIYNFSEDALLLVLADREFEESDYIRDKVEYQNWKNSL